MTMMLMSHNLQVGLGEEVVIQGERFWRSLRDGVSCQLYHQRLCHVAAAVAPLYTTCTCNNALASSSEPTGCLSGSLAF